MKLFGKIIGIVLTTTTMAILVFAIFNAQSVVDWTKLRNYEPSPAVARLASDASLSDEGRKLFYVHDPELLDKPNFQGKCTTTEETIVLGCYISHDKIFVFDVDDPRLEGVEQVTAAHEMLHAAYDRLSAEERTELDGLLISHFESLNDPKLNKTIENYRKRDPSVVPNELHSIFGTEFREIPTELEKHYSRYFINRAQVVSFAEAYDGEFTRREEQIVLLDDQLEQLSLQIDEKENQLALLGVALNQEQSQLESLKSDVDVFNVAVPVFNQKVREYNNQLETLKVDINSYNDLAKSRNLIAVEEKELVEAIDSRIFETE